MKTLSVIIVNYNTGRLLSLCVNSVLHTTDSLRNPQCELVVVDNASVDGSVEKIQNLKIKNQNNKSRFKVIRNTKNLGFAMAVNRRIKQAHGEYILLLNPDTEVRNGAIKKLVEFAQNTNGVGVVGARLLNPDGSIQPSVFHSPTVWRAVREFWLGQKGAYLKYTPEGDSPMMVDAVVGAAFLITPQARKKVGLLDERYFMYFEDLDYCRRVWKSGLKVYYLPSAEVVHRHGASGKDVTDEANQWRRLIPSSKLYHGLLKYYLITFIIWSGSKFQRILSRGASW